MPKKSIFKKIKKGSHNLAKLKKSTIFAAYLVSAVSARVETEW